MSTVMIGLVFFSTAWPQQKHRPQFGTHGKDWRPEQTDIIREVVLVPIIKRWRPGYVVFIHLEGPPPGKGLWHRLLRHNKDIKPETEAQPLDEKHDAPWDARTGKSGGIVSIEPLHWVNDDEVEVGAGTRAGLLDAGHATDHLKWQNHRWTIKRETNRIVS